MESDQNRNTGIEHTIKMFHLEQYAQGVVDYTYRYNNRFSTYYSPDNLIGKYERYPFYGDFPEAYSFRTYGNWWRNSKNFQEDYRPQDIDPLGAEDYVTLEFEVSVVPRDICVYEIFNPGAIVRIWCKNGTLGCRWILLWEGKEESPKSARKFHPKIRHANHLINTLRIEFNHTHLDYHTSIEAVLLAGFEPVSLLQQRMLLETYVSYFAESPKNDMPMLLTSREAEVDCEDLSLNLPYEVLIHIFQYLDLKSLSQCSRVNKRWHRASADPFLYQNLSLKSHWHLIDCNTMRYFMKKCRNLKKLDLSWCGNDIGNFNKVLAAFIGEKSATLTHLSLGNCRNVTSEVIMEIACCRELVDLRLKNTNPCFGPQFATLDYLNKLESLDLTASNIQDDDLITILKENKNLKHLIIDLCENLRRLDEVVGTIVNYNKKIVTWSSWKTLSLTNEGIKLFGNCPNIVELDLGWCLLSKDPGDCLRYIADGCPLLSRLILTQWASLNDQLLMPIILKCKELVQLDIMGILNISAEVCEKAFLCLPKLRLLDIAFCDNIRPEAVEIWRQQYPHITIQQVLH